jgi:hypothetical protein
MPLERSFSGFQIACIKSRQEGIRAAELPQKLKHSRRHPSPRSITLTALYLYRSTGGRTALPHFCASADFRALSRQAATAKSRSSVSSAAVRRLGPRGRLPSRSLPVPYKRCWSGRWDSYGQCVAGCRGCSASQSRTIDPLPDGHESAS